MHGVTVKIRSSSNNKQSLLPTSKGTKHRWDMSPCPPTDLRTTPMFKKALFVYKVLHSTLLTCVSPCQRVPRDAIVARPITGILCSCDPEQGKSFPVSAPLIWNWLPTTVRDVSISMNSFNGSLKAELFHKAYWTALARLCKETSRTKILLLTYLLTYLFIQGIKRLKSMQYTRIATAWFTYFKCTTNAADEKLPAVLLGVIQSHALHFGSHRVDNVLHLVVWEEVWNLSRCQQVIDQHQETFVSHLTPYTVYTRTPRYKWYWKT